MVRVVVGHDRISQIEPPVTALAGARRADDLDDRRTHAGFQKCRVTWPGAFAETRTPFASRPLWIA